MMQRRTDLAMENHELWKISHKSESLAGLRERQRELAGYPCHEVAVTSAQAARSLGREMGTYATLDLTDYWSRRQGSFPRAVKAVGSVLKELLGDTEGTVLVAGLGNRAMTPDAVGPLTVENLLITRHLEKRFCLRSVAAVAPGVLGSTGMESAELIAAAAQRVQPDAVLLVDALAARRLGRLCTSVQLSDTGLSPGSGVGNRRAEISRKSLGVPVFSIGVPTVVDAATLTADVLEEAGMAQVDPEALRGYDENVFVTARNIDAQVKELARVIGYGINFALQNLNVEEITALLQ
ncbi:MAG: GPR endopeptidase [Oscillospiraceae bacterium]|nr:GPR endopeptidase [Oscillospiraceae bacterium]